MELIVVFGLAALAVCVRAFQAPRGAYRLCALSMLAAVALPYAAGFILPVDMNLGGGVIALGLIAIFATIAIFTFIGATARHTWNALAPR
jgi:hypothetical protein